MKKNFMRLCKIIDRARFQLLVIISGFIVLACAQDPIFYDLSMEPVPKVPKIAGTPTNMAVVNQRVYVGSRGSKKIYIFDGSRWSTMPTPGGTLGQLATDGTYLYALVFPNGEPTSSSAIKRYNFNPAPGADNWDKSISAPNGYSIQSLFCTGDGIFAGCQKNSDRTNYAIIFCPITLSGYSLTPNTYFLTGAAKGSGSTFLATLGGGILEFNGSVSTFPVTGTAGALVEGIIYTGGAFVAVGNDTGGNGRIYDSTNGDTFNVTPTGVEFTGAMGIWKKYKYDGANETWQSALVLVGIHGQLTSLTHGYREISLYPDGTYIGGLNIPGNGPTTSVTNQAKYDASLGVNPVNAILQLPPLANYQYPDMTDPANANWTPLMFASTQQNGVWSYRSEQWNAED